MLYIVMTTPICNLSCRYCGGSLHGMPNQISYDVERLQKFIGDDPDSVVAFYGGEPLLEIDTLKHFLNSIQAKYFVLQTNGWFLSQLEDDVHKLDSILLSIDGRREVTDYYRGSGCYDKVMQARNWLDEMRYSGEIIARMAVSGQTDIYTDVLHLLDFFPLVHWQLDAVWSALWEFEEFSRWCDTSYSPSISALIKWWFEQCDRNIIPGIIPFRGVLSRLFSKNPLPRLPCGAGEAAVAITTDGKVMACPICPDFSWNMLGSLDEGFKKVCIGEPCCSCEQYPICGGRCLFAYKEQLWGEAGFNKLCELTRAMINQLQNGMPSCEQYKKRIQYPPFNNTTEIIP